MRVRLVWGSVVDVTVLLLSSHAQNGGSEAYLEQLAARLVADAMDVRVEAVLLEDGPLAGRLRRHGVEPQIVDTGRRAGLLAGAMRLAPRLRMHPPAVVHANGVKAALVAVLATALRPLVPIPVVWVKHDFSQDGWLARLVARRCALVVGVSDAVLTSVLGVAPTAVVPTGIEAVETDFETGRARLEQATGPGNPFLLVVGRLDPAKGFEDAIRVLNLLSGTHPGARLAIVGPDDPSHPAEANRLQRLAAELGVGDRVHALGWRTDARDLIAGADVVLVPSRPLHSSGMGAEGFGLVAVEAMYAGVPVAGYDAGALREVLGGAGCLVPVGSVDALADATRRLVVDQVLRERTITEGRRRAGRYSPEVWARTMADHYRSVAR